MTRLAVFGYGSLIDPASASLTLGRPVAQPLPARLPGWRRGWNILRDNVTAEKTFAVEGTGEVPPFVLSLGIEPDPGSAGPNGALVAVDERELERLDLRELRYDRFEAGAVAPRANAPFDRVFAYRPKAEHRAAARPPAGAVVIAEYLRTVRSAFERLGPGEAAEFDLTTPVPEGVRCVEAQLVSDAIPLGNPRRW